ncbi:LptM family lipoprotein [Lacticaseibacillus sp. GG6-2]
MKKMILLLALLGVASGAAACGNKPAASPASSTKSSKVVKPEATDTSKRTSSSMSAVAKPTRQASVAEKIALVLLTPGAEQYSMTGSRLLSSGDQETATLNGGGFCQGAPSGSVVYALSLEHENKTPFVVMTGDQAYLFASQSPVPYDFLTKHALRVDLNTAWQKNFQSADLTKLSKQISIGQTQEAAGTDSTATESDSDSDSDGTAETAFDILKNNYSTVYTEDSSTVSGSGPMTSQFDASGRLAWVSDDADGNIKYSFDVSDVQPAGAGSYLITLDNGYQMTFTPTSDGSSYTLRCTDLNYYGKFNR